MSDQYGSAFEKDFFPETGVVHIEVDILDELWENLQAEFAENEWTEADGLRFVLAAGLTALQAERLEAERMQGTDTGPKLERLLRERIAKDGSSAVLRYRTYQFMQDARTLSMKLNACRQERDGLSREIKNLQEKLKGSPNEHG